MQPQSSNKFVQNEKEQDMKMKMKVVLPLPIFMAPAAETQTRKATINLDKAIAYELKHGRKLDPKMDTKKLRRTVSNRLSAQRSRVRKAQQIHDMESKVTELENTITMVRLRVESVKENRRVLQQQNEALERLVQIRLQEANVAQMVAEKNKAELGRLKDSVYVYSQAIKHQEMAASFDPNSGSSRIQPSNVGGSSGDVGKMREYWKKEMMRKMISPLPLPPRQPRASSSLSSPPEKSKVSMDLDMAIAFELVHGRKIDVNMDVKLLRRLSAQRSRLKRSQFITDLERRVKELEEVVASLSPRIQGYHEKKRSLRLENDSLRTILEIRAAESKMAEERLEEKRREIREMKEALARANGDQQASSSQHDLGSNELKPKPYSIQFYQERLMQLEMNQFISQELNTGGAEPRQDSVMKSTCDGDEGEEEEVDKYLNLTDEEELDLHLANL
ncbi:hypothetical protein SASPL_127953 [Salvia splendens]|uniref:BZIP domain-containing protein n=1 Tax=Salvia splendens TaxID=180675 RepID=A0A8X8XA72_SALSN|nr:hypothetical protein SASPL_127953 [Salvia splendens]